MPHKLAPMRAASNRISPLLPGGTVNNLSAKAAVSATLDNAPKQLNKPANKTAIEGVSARVRTESATAEDASRKPFRNAKTAAMAITTLSRKTTELRIP